MYLEQHVEVTWQEAEGKGEQPWNYTISPAKLQKSLTT